MNEIQTVEFKEAEEAPKKRRSIYPFLIAVQVVCLLIIYAAAKGWLN